MFFYKDNFTYEINFTTLSIWLFDLHPGPLKEDTISNDLFNHQLNNSNLQKLFNDYNLFQKCTIQGRAVDQIDFIVMLLLLFLALTVF